MTREKTFLAHAAVCPLPACVSTAMTTYVQRAGRAGQFAYLHHPAEEATRTLVAKLIQASPEEIAFVSSTSMGLSLVAAGLDWNPNDNVVIAERDFPANIYPWLNVEQQHGVRVKYIPRRPSGAITVADVAAQVDAHTQLVSLSSVHFSTGTPADIDAIGQYLHERGVLFCVDAIQSLGAFPCSMRHVDFLAADAHKWLLGPQGIGVLFVRREHFTRLRPALLGWKTVRDPDDFGKIALDYPDSARRYEPGSLNAVGLVGLHAALSLLGHVGVTTIARRLADLRSLLITGLEAKDCQILGLPLPHVQTGITSFIPREKNVAAVFQRLADKGIVVSLREHEPGKKCLRVAPHFYNVEADIHRLLENI